MKPKLTINIRPTIWPFTLLTLAFFAAKIFGYINWSWWWVFSPLWVLPLIGIVYLVAAFIFFIAVVIIGVLLS